MQHEQDSNDTVNKANMFIKSKLFFSAFGGIFTL